MFNLWVHQGSLFLSNQLLLDIESRVVHSWWKCAPTTPNNGSPAGSSGAAAFIYGDHLMGAKRDVYIAQERQEIHIQGLPEHSPEFAVLFPDFVPTNKLQKQG